MGLENLLLSPLQVELRGHCSLYNLEFECCFREPNPYLFACIYYYVHLSYLILYTRPKDMCFDNTYKQGLVNIYVPESVNVRYFV